MRATYPAFAGNPNGHLSNPLVDLPAPIGEVVDGDAAS